MWARNRFRAGSSRAIRGYAGNKQASMWPAPVEREWVPASGSTTFACGSSPASRKPEGAGPFLRVIPTALAHMDLGY